MALATAPPAAAAGADVRAAPIQAEPDGELFEIYDEHCNLLGTERRAIVHAKGLLHKAVYCFVFNPEGQLLIQQRSSKKKIGPGQWDLSVAEHLSPGETFHQAAVRGMQEELGISGQQLSPQPLGPMHQRRLVVPNKFYDYEFVESYCLDGFTGEVQHNTEEVSEVRWADLAHIKQRMQEAPDDFTEWFRSELALLQYFGA